jgi:hypothetical protein
MCIHISLSQLLSVLAVALSGLAVVVSLLALIFSLYKWRESLLRRSDVLAWSNQAISAMKTLHLICLLGESYFSADELDVKLKELSFRTSILIEQGRMFFKNQAADYGQEKELAYRGYRARILDHLVVSHLISKRWLGADAESRARMCLLAESHEQMFVSLVQKEVGRSRTASADTKHGGDHINLNALMAKVDQDKVTNFLRR